MLSHAQNAMSVDVEDYFQVSAFENIISRDSWDTLPLRVDYSTNRLLELFARKQVKATFFTLGWVAERRPDLVRRIVAEGHEIASHGYGHERVTEMSRDAFRQDVDRAKKILEDISGEEVIGYRAPSFSINDTNRWVFDELVALGYRYSSSTYPVKHDLYGVPHWPRFKYKLDNGLIEIPMTTLKIGEKTIPISGGGFFRLYPYWLTRFMLSLFHRRESAPGIFYMHPWELDAEQPRQANLPAKTRFRHYLNINKHERRLEKLVSDFKWGRMDEVFSIREAVNA